MNGLRLCCASALLLLLTVAANGQYEPVPVVIDSDPAPGGIGFYDNIDRPNVNAAGLIAFTADLDSATTADDLVIFNDTVIAREGDPAPGTPWTFGLFDQFNSYQHVNASGNVVFVTDLTGAPNTEDGAIYKNSTLVVKQGDPVPGYPGDVWADFDIVAVADNGTVCYRGWITGSGDRAIVRGNTVLFREGELILGTAFDSQLWGTAFFPEVAFNGNGDVLFVGDTDVADTNTDSGLFFQAPGGLLTLLLREGVSTVVAHTGTETYTGAAQLDLHDNGNWILRGKLDYSATCTSISDEVVIASTGTGPFVVMQENDEIPSIPGTSPNGYATVGVIKGCTINASGDTLVLARIDDETGPSISYGFFLNGSLIMTSLVPVGALGTTFTLFSDDMLMLADDGRMYFEGYTGGLDGIFEVVSPGVSPVENLACSLNIDTITATWDVPAGQSYTGFRAYIDGVQQVPDLPGAAVSFTTAPLPVIGYYTISVEGLDGVEVASPRDCSTFYYPAPDHTLCSNPVLAPAIDSTLPPVVDVLPVAIDVSTEDLTVYLGITYPNLYDLVIDVISPVGTSLRLMEYNGGSSNDVDSTFADFGLPLPGADFDASLFLQPHGPGSFADFNCEQSLGNWTLTVAAVMGGGAVGALDEWCVNIYENPNPAASCCASPTSLLCAPTTSGVVELSWTNNHQYSALELAREDSLGSVVTLPLGSSDAGYADSTALFGETYTYALNYVCTTGGPFHLAAECSVNSYFPDYSQCSSPALPLEISLGYQYDTITVTPSLFVDNIWINVDITHTWIGDIELDLFSPLGTSLKLLNNDGGDADDLLATFADSGIPLLGADLVGDLVVQPHGPGTFADFDCELTNGDWTLRAVDTFPGDTGVLNEWCFNVVEEPNPGPDCCPQPTSFDCASIGACGGPGVTLLWTNNFAYDNLTLLRDDGVGGIVTTPLNPMDNSHTDLAVVDGTTYIYTLRYICAATGTLQAAGQCSVDVETIGVPPVTDMAATIDPCDTGTVILEWNDNGVPYDSLTLSHQGLFLADVTGLLTYTHTNPAGGVATYSIVASCGINTAVSGIAVDYTSTPISNFVATSDYCINEVALTWDDHGYTYDNLTLLREGSFIADVTGLSSYVDFPTTGGIWNYSIEGTCNPATPNSASTSVDHAFAGPSDFVCESPLCDGVVNLSWVINGTYSTLELYVDGAPVSPQPQPDDTTYTLTLPSGFHLFDLVGGCSTLLTQVECTIDVVVLAGQTDVVLRLERDGGIVDSAGAMAAALEANGNSALVLRPVDGATLTDLPCGIDLSTFQRIWVAAGTYPTDWVGMFDAANLNLLGTLNRNNGIHIYFESNDYWGWEHTSSILDQRDGIQWQSTNDGDDEFTSMNGANSLAGLDTSLYQQIHYEQDAGLANEFTDEFVLSGTGPWAADEGTDVAGVIWFNHDDTATGEPVFATGVFSRNISGGHMISCSWEFGGFNLDVSDPAASDADRTALMALYLGAFSTVTPPQDQFVRGEINFDTSGVNIADAVYLLGYLFPSSSTPNEIFCQDAADTNDDGSVNIGDAVSLLGALFGNPAIPLPLPNSNSGCGVDPTGDSLDCATSSPGC